MSSFDNRYQRNWEVIHTTSLHVKTPGAKQHLLLNSLPKRTARLTTTPSYTSILNNNSILIQTQFLRQMWSQKYQAKSLKT